MGDTLMDIDLHGHASRLCPDAPAPIVEVTRRLERAGGAGLVATMLAEDGHDVDLITALSNDQAAARLRDLLSGVRVSAGALGGPTPVKMRLIADGQRVARIDEGCGQKPFPWSTRRCSSGSAGRTPSSSPTTAAGSPRPRRSGP
ncbi:hypothetical protein [Sinomonas atrocyanea]